MFWFYYWRLNYVVMTAQHSDSKKKKKSICNVKKTGSVNGVEHQKATQMEVITVMNFIYRLPSM